jgi:lysophospholipase L1-like esterase
VAVITCVAEGSFAAADRLGLFPTFFSDFDNPYPPWDVKSGDGLYFAHPYTSYGMKPDYVRWDSLAHVNSLGFRGPDTPREKPSGKYRIVALGASTTYGIGLADEDTYPAQLEAALRYSLPSIDVEVINAGLVSATTAESLHRFFTDILPLSPDMIFIYHGYNDLVPRMFNDFAEDYYHFRKIPGYTPTVLEKTYLYRLVLRSLAPDRFSENRDLLNHIWKFDNLPVTDEVRITNFRSTSSDAFRLNLDYLITSANARGIQVVMATFAFSDDEYDWNQHMPSELWAEGIHQNNAAIADLAAKHAIPLVDFYGFALNDWRLFKDSIHMTEYGNQQMAALLAGTIGPVVRESAAPGTRTPGGRLPE